MPNFRELLPTDLPSLEEVKKEVKIIEPGHKIPVANYLQIGQWCETCQDVKAHVYSKETNKIRCLKCKTTKQLK